MIDARAVVDAAAELAPDVVVGPYTVIGPKVTIDAGTRIGPHVIINGPCHIGKDNRVFQFCSLGDEPQDKKYLGEPTELRIGDGNTIREYCSINRGTAQDRGATVLGADNWIMAYVHIAHDCLLGDGLILANAVTLAGHVSVGDHAILGGFTKVHQFCRIGAHAFCAMDTGVSRDIPPYVMAAGHLAQPKGINSEGLKRRGFDAERVRGIRRAYRLLYRSDLKLDESIRQIEALDPGNPDLVALVEFLRGTERSIIR